MKEANRIQVSTRRSGENWTRKDQMKGPHLRARTRGQKKRQQVILSDDEEDDDDPKVISPP